MTNPWLEFDKKWNVPPIEQGGKPVFALASIWRSGSTLLQRLLCSDPDILLWGEPYGDAGFLPGLANSARCLLRSGHPSLYAACGCAPCISISGRMLDVCPRLWLYSTIRPPSAPNSVLKYIQHT